MKEDLQEAIEKIIEQLPITEPAQLYLRKGDEYIASYDPVTKIEVLDHSINIKNGKVGLVTGKPHVYNHSYDEFDRIYIVPNGDEPVIFDMRTIN